MHFYVKQIIQTLCVNDQLRAFLTNQQSHEENNWLSSVFARSRDYRPENLPPKEKVIVQMQKKQTNVQMCRS